MDRLRGLLWRSGFVGCEGWRVDVSRLVVVVLVEGNRSLRRILRRLGLLVCFRCIGTLPPIFFAWAFEML